MMKLKKLLWQDRVYFVEVDGFDELMAELHDSLLPSELPIKNNFVYEKTALIDNIINNPHLKIIKSPFITKHVNLMKNTKHFSSRQGLIDVYEEQEQNSFSSHKISQNCNLSRKESFHIFVLNEIKESKKNYKELVDEINSLQSHKQNSFFLQKKNFCVLRHKRLLK